MDIFIVSLSSFIGGVFIGYRLRWRIYDTIKFDWWGYFRRIFKAIARQD